MRPPAVGRYTYVPRPFQAANKTLLWYRSMLLRYILRPTDETVRMVEAERVKILPLTFLTEANAKAVAIHVRMTDGGATGVTRLSARAFLKAARAVTGGTVKQALVVTDDYAHVKRAVANLPEAGGMSFSLLGEDLRRNTDSTNKIMSYRKGTRDAQEDLHAAVLDLFLAAACDYFVGQYQSNFSRLIFELIFARLGNAVWSQTKSLQGDWFVNP